MPAFDRRLARGPWRALPVPVNLADRRAGLAFQLAWAGALAVLLVGAAGLANGPTRGLLFQSTTLQLLGTQSLPLLLVAVGMAAVFARGGVDFSVGAVSMIAGAIAVKTGSPALGLLAALGCGLANGLLVAVVRAPGWLVTALTFAVLQELGDQILGRRGFLPLASEATLDGILAPAIAIIAALMAIAAFQILPRGAPRRGRIGDLGDAVPYVLSALLAGFAGIHTAASVGGATRGGVNTIELLLAVILGGTFLGSGRANVLGAAIAAFGLTALRAALTFADVAPSMAYLVQPPLLLLGLAVSGGVHALAADRFARKAPDAPGPEASASARPRIYDRALFHGPGKLVPVPVYLTVRRWALKLELGWSAALALSLAAVAVALARTEGGLSFESLEMLSIQLVPSLLIALGACAVVARGALDFSAPVLAMMAAQLAARGSLATAVVLAVGIGIFHGALVVFARVPGWLLTFLTAAGQAWLVLHVVDARFVTVGQTFGWARTLGLAALGAAVIGAFAWIQLGSGRANRPVVRWRERLGDGLPYLFSSLLACCAGLYYLASVGGVGPKIQIGGETLAALIFAGCWLGAGRANVIGVVLASTGLAATEYLLTYHGAKPGTINAAISGVALVALAASRVVHLVLGGAYARTVEPERVSLVEDPQPSVK
jgi:ribose/xylose/arabinose/galactoside ABC-type transport system permease subunit